MARKEAGVTEENRGKQIFVGGAIIFTLFGTVVTFLMCWRYIPGWVGESVGTLVGVMTTPFFMETSFFLLGLVIVVSLNAWRRHRAGDEYVTLKDEQGQGDRPDPR